MGRDGRFDPGRVLAVIAEIDADAIALQEVDSRRGPHADAFRLLSERSGLHATAGPNIRAARGAYGNLLLTRWPPARAWRVDLSVAPREPRGAVIADLALAPGRVRLAATHLGLRRGERREQITRLAQALTQRAEHLELLGELLDTQHPDLPDPRDSPAGTSGHPGRELRELLDTHDPGALPAPPGQEHSDTHERRSGTRDGAHFSDPIDFMDTQDPHPQHPQHPRGVALAAVLADFNVAWWRGPDLFGQRVTGIAPRTFPARRPLLALDRVHVWPRCALRSLRAHASALAREASDHLPVVAEVVLEAADA